MCSDHYGLLWSCMVFKNYLKCNAVQNRAIHAFLGEHRFASTLEIHGDAAWTPPIIRRHLEILKFCLRIVTLPSS